MCNVYVQAALLHALVDLCKVILRLAHDVLQGEDALQDVVHDRLVVLGMHGGHQMSANTGTIWETYYIMYRKAVVTAWARKDIY